MQAWNIYLSVILTHNAAQALELIGYQRIITSANQFLPLKAWLQHDGQFRTLAAFNPTSIGICATRSYGTGPWPLPTLRGTLNDGHAPTVELKTIFLRTAPLAFS